MPTLELFSRASPGDILTSTALTNTKNLIIFLPVRLSFILIQQLSLDDMLNTFSLESELFTSILKLAIWLGL